MYVLMFLSFDDNNILKNLEMESNLAVLLLRINCQTVTEISCESEFKYITSRAESEWLWYPTELPASGLARTTRSGGGESGRLPPVTVSP